MPAIDDYLRQHPELADKDPARVAQFVYDTQIKATGKSQQRFEEYFLGAPIKSDRFFGAEHGDAAPIKWGKSLVNGAADMIKGDAEFDDVGNLNYAGIGGDGLEGKAKLAGASMMGSDKDVENELARQYPDAQFSDDENGNRMVTMADGRKSYLNLPGLDSEDAIRFLGKALAFAGAGAAGALAKGAGMLGRVAAVGGASGATDAGMQKLAGREEIDGGQVALSATIGGAAEAVAPAIGAVVGKVRDKYKAAQWNKMSTDAQRRIIARQLTRDGFSPDDLRGMSREELATFGKARVDAGDLVSPDATIAQSEFGYKVTRGQQMPDGTPTQRAGKFSQLADEERLRSTESGQRFRDLEADNALQTDSNIRGMTDRLGGNQADTALEGAEQVQSGLIRAERAAKGQVDDAYNTARQYDAELADETILAIPDRITEALRTSATTLDNDLTPGATKVLKDITDNPVTSIKDLEIQRQRINNMFSDTMDRRDRRALKIIKDEFDDSIGDAIDNQMFTGDPQALAALKDARSLYADYAKKFRSNDEAGKVVQKMLDIDATPEQISNLMVGVNGLSKAGSARIAKRYGEIVGRDSPEFNALRETAFLTITRKPTGESKGAQQLVSTLKKAMKGQGSSLMKELYTEGELATIKRFTVALESTLKSGDFARSSGTAERMLRFYNSGGFRNLPFVDSFKGILENNGVNRALMPPPSMIKPVSIAAPANATVSSQ